VYAAATAFQVGFDGGEACRELLVGGSQGAFRLEREFSSEIGDRKQQVAQFLGRPCRVLGQRFAQFTHFLLDLVHDACSVWPVEADGRHARADFVRAQQAWQRLGHSRQQARLGPGLLLFRRFDLFPLCQHLGRRLWQSRATLPAAREGASRRCEDMRVAADEFGGDGVQRICHLESPGFSGDLRVEYTLEHHIPEFARQRIEVAPVQRLQGFIGFLQQERPQGLVGLLPIPRAATLRAKGGHDPHKPRHGSGSAGGTGCRRLDRRSGERHGLLKQQIPSRQPEIANNHW